MKKRHWFIAIGTLISLSILAILFARLDWQTFWQTLQNLRFQELLFATVLMWISIAIRSLRWLFIARQPVKNYVAFWQANSIGYLGNMIYRNFTSKGKCAGNCNCGIDQLENKI